MDLYQGMKEMGFELNDIVKYAQASLEKTTDPYRYDVYSAILKIAGVVNEGPKE